jgi:TRAP-type C4-dicarboxylate transport system substrate-binding protein
MKGLKIRVMNSPVYLDTFKQLGASPVALPFSETYNALQTGVVDAQDNPILTSILMKFTEVTKYATLTHHSLNECITVVGADYWNKLSKPDQQIFLEAAEILKNVNRDVNAKLHLALPGSNTSINDYAKANNVEIIELTVDEREQFRKAMIPVWDKYRKEIGNDVFDLMLKKIDQHKI